MSLDSSIIFDTDPSYINRIPYSIIESKRHSEYIKKFINEKKIIKYYISYLNTFYYIIWIFTGRLYLFGK